MQEKNAILDRINGVNNDLMGLKQKNQSLKESNSQLESELNSLNQKFHSTKISAPISNSGKTAPISNSKPGSNAVQLQNSQPYFVSPSSNNSANKISLTQSIPKVEEKPISNTVIDLFSVPEDQDFDANPFAVASSDDGSNPFLSNSAPIIDNDNLFVKKSAALNVSPPPVSAKPQPAASTLSFDNFDSWDNSNSFSSTTQSKPAPSTVDFNSWDDPNPFETSTKPAVTKSRAASPVKKDDFGFANNDNWADF